MNFFKKLTPFNKVFFIVFLLIDVILFLLPAFTQGSISVLLTPIAIITFICSISGILMAIYNAEASLHFFIWGLVNTTTYTYITFVQSLYGQVIVTAFAIIPVQIVGLYLWTKNTKANNGDSIQIKRFSKKLWVNHLTFFILGSIIYGFFLVKLPYLINHFFNITISPDGQVVLDSINAMATLLAMYTGAQRYIEQWLFWVIANTTGIIMFVISFMHSSTLSVDSISTAIMWLQLEINTFYGYFHWKKSLKA